MKILKSKLQIPALSEDWIDRDRLVEELLASDETRLIVLQAPAGFGKTTLTRQFLDRQKKTKSAWIHLERNDSDPRRFTGYVIEALARIFPSLAWSELSKSVADHSKPLVELHDDLLFMLEELNDSIGWLVLDNWEDVDESKQVRELVNRIILLENAGPRILIASRKPLALKTGKLRAEGKAILLTERDLAFNLYECESLLQNQTRKTVDSNLLERLWRATLGWCVSVGLYLKRLESDGDTPILRPPTNNSEHTLDAYIDEEILGKIDSRLSDFVIRCSVLDSISLESASVVCQTDCDIKPLMLALSASSLPHTLLNNGLIIRLHPLFRQAANKLLHRKYSHEEITAIYRKSSEFFLSQGRTIDAIESHTQVGDGKSTLALIETYWYELVAANGLGKIDDWLKATSRYTRAEPLYIDLYSRALIQRGENQKAIAYLSDNLDLEKFKYERSRLLSLKTRYHWARINTEPDPTYNKTLQELTALSDSDSAIDNNVLAGVEVVLCATAYMELKLAEGIAHAEKALELIGDSLPEYRFGVQDNLAILEHTRGNSQKALSLFKAGVSYCEASGSFSGVPLRSYNMAWIHATTGDYQTALELIEFGRETSRRYSLNNVYAQMYAERYEGVIRWYLGEHQKSFRLLNRALELAKEHNPKEHLETAIALEHCLLMSGKSGATDLQSNVPAQGARRETRLCYLGLLAYQKIRISDAEALYECAKEMEDISLACGLLPWHIHACFLLALAGELRQDFQTSREYINNGLATMDKINWNSYPMPNELLSAFVFAKATRHAILPTTAHKLVNSGFRVEVATEFEQELQSSQTTAERLRLLKTAIELNIRRLSPTIKALAGSKEPEVVDLARGYLRIMQSSKPSPLSITTFGTFEVIQEGPPVRFARKTSLRLFQWLLTVYPKPLHKEIIIDYFWPETSPAKGNSSLRTTIKDIRKALDPYNNFDSSAYLTVQDSHYSLCLPDNSYVDSIVFLDSLSRAEGIALQNNPQSGQFFERDLRAALTLYEGEYLPMQVYEEFSAEQRVFFLAKYLRASVLLSQYLMKNDRTPEAIAVLKDALKCDPLWGDGVYLLIKALSQMGYAVEAMKTFRTYEQKLACELQVEPDAYMVDLFLQLSS